MAIIWEKCEAGVTYQVREAGRTRRLYTNGVFHSQYNPAQPVGGSVWDLLMLPAFFFPPAAVRRVLVLGVGGGAVIKQLQHFLTPEQILGIELNPIHLHVAEHYFDVSGGGIKLVQDDAVKWVRDRREGSFDLIIDDLFGEDEGEPVRAVAADAGWFNALLRCLSPQGALVMNFDSSKAMRDSAYFGSKPVQRRFGSAFEFSTPLYDNRVGAFMRRKCERGDLFASLAQEPQLDIRRKSCRLNFDMRKLRVSGN